MSALGGSLIEQHLDRLLEEVVWPDRTLKTPMTRLGLF
jgi:hypothetical protein